MRRQYNKRQRGERVSFGPNKHGATDVAPANQRLENRLYRVQNTRSGTTAVGLSFVNSGFAAGNQGNRVRSEINRRRRVGTQEDTKRAGAAVVAERIRTVNDGARNEQNLIKRTEIVCTVVQTD